MRVRSSAGSQVCHSQDIRKLATLDGSMQSAGEVNGVSMAKEYGMAYKQDVNAIQRLKEYEVSK